jgi:DNA ligase-associated metallophosphoesterase
MAFSRPARDKLLHLFSRAFVADPSGALFCPDERVLVVADLHLQKGVAYAARRVFLPPYDTAATLARLADVVGRRRPKRVVALGDSFHDGEGAGRLTSDDARALRAIQAGHDWIWIAGNHDPIPSSLLEGDRADCLAMGPIRLCHEPGAASAPDAGEIAGHLHPSAIIAGRGGATRRRCFVADAQRCILPAFGAYAGGLNIRDIAFDELLAETGAYVHVLGRETVYTVARRQCLRETRSAAVWR